MQKVLIGAKFLIMPDLARACETYLASDKHLVVENCMYMLRFARKYACWSLFDAVSSLAAQKLPHFVHKPEFLNLNKKEISELLLSETVVTLTTTYQRCRAAVAWLNHDRPARDACVSDILNLIPFDWSSTSLGEVELTLAAAGANFVISTEDAGKFMDAVCDTGVKHQRTDHQNYSERAVWDVWWDEVSNITSGSDMWYAIGGVEAPDEFVTYDVKRRCWSALPDLPWTRVYAGACVIRNKTVCLFGGCKDDKVSADIDQFNLSTHKWTTSSTKLTAARMQAGTCVSEQSAYLCGGYFNEASRIMEKLHFSANESGGKLLIDLELMAEMPACRYHNAAIYANGAVFVAGGCILDRGGPRLSSIEKFDCVANKWSIVGNMKCGGRSSLMEAVFGDDLYLAGGHDGGGAVDVVEIFNIRTGQFRRAPSMLSARCSGGGVALDRNTFCVVGGGTGFANVSSVRGVECFDVREGKWSTGVIVPDMPTANRKFCFAYA